jgi:hypothetical protein
MSSYILNVPYKSQNDPDAQVQNNDCGPACIAMILLSQGQSVATADVYAASGAEGDRALTFAEVTAAAAHYSLPLRAQVNMSLQDVRNSIDQGTPLIALVKYQYLPDRQGQSTTGGHFVIVVGYDDDAGEIVINDPYYWASLRSQGDHHHYSYDTWEQAWGRCNEDGNPNHSALIPRVARPVPPLPDYVPTPPPPGTVFVLPAVDRYGGLKLRPVRDTSVAGQAVFSGRPLTVVQGPVAIGNASWALVRTQSADDIAGWACVQSGGEAYIGDRPDATTSTTMIPIMPLAYTVYVQPDADKYGGLKLRAVRDTNLGGPAMLSGTALNVVAEPVGSVPHEWLLVTAQDGKDTAGWVHTRQAGEVYVSDTPSAPPVVFALPEVADLWVIATAGLWLRTHRDMPAGPGSPTALFGQHLTALEPESAPDAKNRTWIQIRTDDGVVAWAPASENGEPYLSNFQPYRAEVLDTQPVRDAGGLRMRDQRNIDATVLDLLQIGQQFDVYYRVVESDGTPWLWSKSPNNRYGWVREKLGDVILVAEVSQPPTGDVRPFGKCLAGVGVANPQPLTGEEVQAIAKGKVAAVKVLTLPDPDENKQLIRAIKNVRQDMFIVARLFFSIDFDNKPSFSPQNFVDFVSVGLGALYESGVRYFEVHNEPNLKLEGLEWNWRNGAEFGNWFALVLGLLRQRCPEGKFGFPGLSPQFSPPDTPVLSAESDVNRFLTGAAPAIAQSDWVGVHCYWQNDSEGHWGMQSESDGMFWKQFRTRFPDKLLMITEFSNNNASVNPAEKGRQYARYFQLLRDEPNLGAAFAFALSWPGQDVNREGWVYNGQATGIPTTLGPLIAQL